MLMLETQEQVILAYTALWSTADPSRIAALVATCLMPDARIQGPGYEFIGHAAIVAEAQRFAAALPRGRAVLASGIDHHHGTARFAIAMVAADGTVTQRGEDVVLFAPSGLIDRVLTYWRELPPIPGGWPSSVVLKP